MKFRKHYVKLSNKTGVLHAQTGFVSPGKGWERYYPKSCSNFSFTTEVPAANIATGDTFDTFTLTINGVAVLVYTLNVVIENPVDLLHHLKRVLNSFGYFSYDLFDNGGTPTYLLKLTLSCEYVEEYEKLIGDVIDAGTSNIAVVVS